MKYLVKGIALGMFAAAASVVAAPTMTQSMMSASFGLGMKGVFAKRDFQTTSSAQTTQTNRCLAYGAKGDASSSGFCQCGCPGGCRWCMN